MANNKEELHNHEVELAKETKQAAAARQNVKRSATRHDNKTTKKRAKTARSAARANKGAKRASKAKSSTSSRKQRKPASKTHAAAAQASLKTPSRAPRAMSSMNGNGAASQGDHVWWFRLTKLERALLEAARASQTGLPDFKALAASENVPEDYLRQRYEWLRATTLLFDRTL